ncbi:MAG: UPF0721 transmembrane protein [Candidatus Poribacteria bacterium]|nr:MAG: UPF0721 transmembrane protein [Candidatus Poribacteria bacterium]
MSDFFLFPLGLAIAAYAVMVGTGGGFLLVPILVQLYSEPPAVITSISLSVTFLGSLSGVFAYARQRRVDYLTSGLLSMGAFPGAALGAFLTRHVPRELFSATFGVLLLLLAAFLLRPDAERVKGEGLFDILYRRIADNHGAVYEYRYNPFLAVLLALVTSATATLFGIGGGVLFVPLAVRWLRIPPHVAVATTSLVVAVSSGTGVLVHATEGHIQANWDRILFLALGAVLGAQIGARLAGRISERALLRALAVGLIFLGVRLLWTAVRA